MAILYSNPVLTNEGFDDLQLRISKKVFIYNTAVRIFYRPFLPVLSLCCSHHAEHAINGDSVTATQLFEKSYNGTDDILGWNLYVDATIALMKQDRTALAKAYFALANLPVPPNTQLDQNGNSLAAEHESCGRSAGLLWPGVQAGLPELPIMIWFGTMISGKLFILK